MATPLSYECNAFIRYALKSAKEMLQSEVNIDLKWTADSRTQLAIQRQTKLMGFESADDYLRQIIATTIAILRIHGRRRPIPWTVEIRASRVDKQG